MGKYKLADGTILELTPDPESRNPLDRYDSESKERLSDLIGLTVYQVYLTTNALKPNVRTIQAKAWNPPGWKRSPIPEPCTCFCAEAEVVEDDILPDIHFKEEEINEWTEDNPAHRPTDPTAFDIPGIGADRRGVSH